jgi:hypothetical protein
VSVETPCTFHFLLNTKRYFFPVFNRRVGNRDIIVSTQARRLSVSRSCRSRNPQLACDPQSIKSCDGWRRQSIVTKTIGVRSMDLVGAFNPGTRAVPDVSGGAGARVGHWS